MFRNVFVVRGLTVPLLRPRTHNYWAVQGRQKWGRSMPPPPIICQAKLYVVLDFKISNEVLNFEIKHSKY